MKIAASTTKGGVEDTVIEIFGRAPSFTIVEVKDGKISGVEVVDNESASASGGAGIAAAQLMVDKNVEIVLTGNLGPNAYNVLSAAGIKVYQAAGMKVEEAVNKAIRGELSDVTPGGMGRGMGRGRGGGRGRGMGRGMGRGAGRGWF